MKERKFITPTKPVLRNNFSCYIRLKKSQVDSSSIRELAISQGFREQRFRHITILSPFANQTILKKVLNKLSEDKIKIIIKKLREKIGELTWEYEEKGIYFVTKKISKNEQRYSYIMLIKMPDIEKFFKYLNKLFDLDILAQYPHITLFTKGERKNPDYYGIAIPSKKEFQSLKPIKII